MKHHIATTKNGLTYIMCAHKIHKGSDNALTGLTSLQQFKTLPREWQCEYCRKMAEKLNTK
jgi:hypothetical protein